MYSILVTMQYRLIRIVALLLVLQGALLAGEGNSSGLDFSGLLYTDLALAQHSIRKEAGSPVFAGASRFSTLFRNSNREHAKVEGELELWLPYGSTTVRQTVTSAAPAGDDSTATAYSDAMSMGTAPVLFTLRRLYLELYLPWADVALGRQIINFGKGAIFSPLDAFSSVELTDLDFRRRGSDVALLRVPLGTMSGFDLITETPLGREQEYATATKLFTTLANWDISLVGIYRHHSGEGRIGGAFKGDLGVGVYGELVEHGGDAAHKSYSEAMIGCDYSLQNQWFFAAEYLFKEQDQTSLSIWARNNGYASVQFAPTELMRFSINGIFQFERQQTIGTVSWYYNVVQNGDLTLYLRAMNGFSTQDVGFSPPELQYGVRVAVRF